MDAKTKAVLEKYFHIQEIAGDGDLRVTEFTRTRDGKVVYGLVDRNDETTPLAIILTGDNVEAKYKSV